MFTQSTPDTLKLIHSIALFYWFCIAGLLFSYVSICFDEDRQNRNLLTLRDVKERYSKVEKWYSKILIGNLFFTGIFIVTFGIYNYFLTVGLDNLIKPIIQFLILISIPVSVVAYLTVSYYLLAPLYFYIEDRINVNSIMLLGAVAFFDIAIKLLTHL